MLRYRKLVYAVRLALFGQDDPWVQHTAMHT